MNNDLNEQSYSTKIKEYRFLWIRFKKPERREIYLILFRLSAVALAAVLVILFPQGNCTCEDQVTDLTLETLARQGNKQVMLYQKERESVIICAAKREELLQKLEQEENLNKRKSKGSRRKKSPINLGI